jgi:hypothetical protein
MKYSLVQRVIIESKFTQPSCVPRENIDFLEIYKRHGKESSIQRLEEKKKIFKKTKCLWTRTLLPFKLILRGV